MIDRYQAPEPDARLEQIDEQLIRCHEPGNEESLVAGRIFEASRKHLARAGATGEPALRIVDEDGPSMLGRARSAWPIMAALAAMVVLATTIAILFGVQASRNNSSSGDVAQDMTVEQDRVVEQGEFVTVDDLFEDEFSVATSTLMSDITASVDALLTAGDEWAYGAMSSELETGTSNLWEDLDSF